MDKAARGSAKVQSGAELLCKSVRSEYRVWSIEYRERLESIRSKGNRRPDDWLGALGRAGSPSPPKGRFGEPSLPVTAAGGGSKMATKGRPDDWLGLLLMTEANFPVSGLPLSESYPAT